MGDKKSEIKKIMEDLKKEYLLTLPNKFSAIEKASHETDKAILRNEFHKIKGTGKTYGYPEVSLLGAAMEKICDLNPSDLNIWVKRSLELLKKTIENRTNNLDFLIESEADYQLMIQYIDEHKKV